MANEAQQAAQAARAERRPVFILDVDNTLLDNDAIKTDYDRRLRELLGGDLTARFWTVYEHVRAETGTVDYPLTLDRFRSDCPDPDLLERARAVLLDYPFAERLYPDTVATLAHLRQIGEPAIVSDGDQRYQALKIERSGLRAAVEERVLIYVHKEDHLPTILTRWPAPLYVMVDDKARILSAVKARFPDRFVTVHVRQGHYGLETERYDPSPDLSIGGIGDLRHYTVADFLQHVGA